MSENSCTCPGCLIPLADVIGPLPTGEAEKWAASEGVELRRSWNGRLALDAADAAVVYQRATAAAEAARERNMQKTRALAEASYGSIPKGRPAPEGLADQLDAIDVMLTQEKVGERLDAADERWADYTSGGITYHPIRREED